MALRGSLGDFGIGDIFQLLVAQRKTGDLFIQGVGASRVRIGFVAGRIIDVEAQRSRRQGLGQRLLRGRLLSSANLKRALKEQRRTKKLLGNILSEHQTVAVADIDALLDLQRRETVLSVFEYTQGEYRFEAKPYGGAPTKRALLDPNSLLMDAIRRAEEWPLVRARITNFDTVFRKTQRGAATTPIEHIEEDEGADEESEDDMFGDWGSLVGVVPDESELGRHRLRELVDGRLTVHQLVDRSFIGEFETCKALVGLWDDGEIEPAKEMRARIRPSARHRLSPRRVALTVAVNVLTLGCVVGLYVLLPQTRSEVRANTERAVSQSLGRLRSNRLSVAAVALEVYRVRHGAYPPSLRVVVEEGLVHEALLSPPDGVPLDYVGIGTDYVLR
jgi:hypothetical protein